MGMWGTVQNWEGGCSEVDGGLIQRAGSGSKREEMASDRLTRPLKVTGKACTRVLFAH